MNHLEEHMGHSNMRALVLGLALTTSCGGREQCGNCDVVHEGGGSVSGDCMDSDPRVHPGQEQFFEEPIQGRSAADSLAFDYNCDGKAEIQYEFNTMRSVSPASAVTCHFAPFDVCNGGKVWITDGGEPLPDSSTCGQPSYVQICGPVLPQESFPGVGCAGGSIVAEIVACR